MQDNPHECHVDNCTTSVTCSNIYVNMYFWSIGISWE